MAALIARRGTSIGSEVYLATDRVRGAKNVAIKRLAAGLTRDDAIVGRYVAVAKDVANRLRHPNVMELRAVANEGRDVFVVMDYVMGETLARFVRELHEAGDTLDARTAAYVIGEAAAGLEAAHRVSLVHGHLTPYDIFLGYDGSVKVLDIGIAAAKLAMTAGDEAPPVREIEIQYASPESCKGHTPDRRSDVFSLGAILWELLTGVSPFERAERADTIKAICDDPIPSPGAIRREGLPGTISEITMTALERDPEKRCADAAKLRQLVLGYVGSDKPARAELARLMTKTFEKRARDKATLVERVAAKPEKMELAGLDIEDESELGIAGLHEADLDARIPSGIAAPSGGAVTEGPKILVDPPSDPSLLAGAKPPRVPFYADDSAARVARQEPTSLISRPEARAEPAPPRARSNKRRAAFIAFPILAVGILFAAVVLPRRSKPVVATTPVTTAPVSVTPSVTATAVFTAAPSATAEPAASVATSEQTLVTIDTIPTHASISVGGKKMGISPLELMLPKSSTEVTVEIQHAGYVTLKERIVPDVNQRLKLTLVSAKGTGKPAAKDPYRKFE